MVSKLLAALAVAGLASAAGTNVAKFNAYWVGLHHISLTRLTVKTIFADMRINNVGPVRSFR